MTNQPTKTKARLINKAMEYEAFKHELMSNTKAVIARKAGQEWSESIDIKVLEKTPNKLSLVLRLDGDAIASQSELSEEQLSAVAGGIAPVIIAAAIKGAAQVVSAINDEQ